MELDEDSETSTCALLVEMVGLAPTYCSSTFELHFQVRRSAAELIQPMVLRIRIELMFQE